MLEDANQFKSTVSNKVFGIVRADSASCTGCAFEYNSKECFSLTRPPCHALDTVDHRHTIFKEIK